MFQNKKKCKSYLWPRTVVASAIHPIHLVSTIIEKQQHLNKVNNRIHVKITYRVFYPSLLVNNKTTVTYVMMQTTQKDSFFKIIDSLMKYMGVWKPVIRFKVVLIRTQAVKFCKKFDQFKKRLHLNKKNILGFSFFKSSMWNYLPVHT